jgi:hypothetical protein
MGAPAEIPNRRKRNPLSFLFSGRANEEDKLHKNTIIAKVVIKVK